MLKLKIKKIKTKDCWDEPSNVLISPLISKGELVYLYGEDKTLIDDLLLSILDTRVSFTNGHQHRYHSISVIESASSFMSDIWSMDKNKRLKILFVYSLEENIINFTIDKMYLRDHGVDIFDVDTESVNGMLWSSDIGELLLKLFNNNYDLIIFSSYHHFFSEQYLPPSKTHELLSPFMNEGRSFLIGDMSNKKGTHHKGFWKLHKSDAVVQVERHEHFKHSVKIRYESAKLHISKRFDYAGLTLHYEGE